MVDTFIRNEYEYFWVEDPEEHHKNIIGEYHVSTIGCDHSDLKPDEHSGPCIRETFYVYVNKILSELNPKIFSVLEKSNHTTGIFHQGELMHKEVQRIYILNHGGSIIEYPLGRGIKIDCDLVKILGSIDITQAKITLIPMNNEWDVLDLKSSSDWTFPKDKDDKNPTHFDQTKVYSHILITFNLNPKYNSIRNLYVVYMAKHDLYTGRQRERFDAAECEEKYNSFIERVGKLHRALKCFKIYFDKRDIVNCDKCLPDKEPHKWCKFCNFRHRCFANTIFEELVPTYTIDDIETLYQMQTGKAPIWRNKYTKAFEAFKYKFKIEGEE